jgi:small subunit ribosomal protein S16
MGRRHRPFYRIGVCDARTPRDGKLLERLGHYDPLGKTEDQQVVVNAERVQYWLSRGAQPTETVASLLRKKGIQVKKG